MKKLIALTLMIFLLAVTVSARSSEDISFGSVRVSDTSRNDILFASVNLVKEKSAEIDNARVRLFIPELGLFGKSRKFDIDKRRTSRFVYMDVPNDVKPGYYMVRIVVSGDNFNKRVKHRWVYIR